MEKQKLAVCLLLLGLVTFSIFAYVSASGGFGFEVYETRTGAWDIDLDTVYVGIPKSFTVTVECKEETGEFLVTYHLEISGPENLCNDYLRLRWRDTDSTDFTIGKDGQPFSGTGTLTWKGNSVDFEAGHKNNITLTLTFLTLKALGDYNAKMWVAFIRQPETPRAIKEDALAELEAAKLLTADKHTLKKIDKAIKHIQKSLDPDLWMDNSHLDPKHGHKVFDEEKKAVKHLMKILKDKKENQAVKNRVQAAINKLMTADELLADTVINDANALGSTDPKVIHEIEKAEKELAKAKEKIVKEHYDRAVDHFKKAWRHAQHAIKKAA